ncbi:MAG: B12-binding domain-containing protein, partial [Anaerolineaceae bacterium]
MSNEKYQAISKAVTEGEDILTGDLVKAALDSGLPPLEILQQGVVAGITKAGELWKANKYFLPDVILSADAFKVGMQVLEPQLKNTQAGQSRGKYVIGVVEGDMHDLG